MELNLNLNKEHLYILAVSGGVDSMCLLDLMIKNSYQFVCVHFDHQKRIDSKLDSQLIAQICLNNNIKYHVVKLDITGSNFQATARNLRQTHLEKIALEYQTKYIVTAHHLDDLLETMLIRLTRGTNLLGLSGLREKTKIRNYYYLKPLLKYDKDTIKAYASTNNISYLEDSTNEQNDYLRNKFRNTIIPQLKLETNIMQHLLSLSNNLYQTHLYLRNQSLLFLNNKKEFDIISFQNLDPVIQKDVIASLLESVNKEFSYSYLEEIIKQLTSKKPNIIFQVNNSYQMIKAYQTVKLIANNPKNDVSGKIDIIFSHKLIIKPSDYIQICYNKLDFPLLVRKRKNGDILNFPFGNKKLKSFLIDKKVPLYQRDSLDVITDSNDIIIWIPNLYINQTLGNNNKIYITLKGD